jgi:hypothetical protein
MDLGLSLMPGLLTPARAGDSKSPGFMARKYPAGRAASRAIEVTEITPEGVIAAGKA